MRYRPASMRADDVTWRAASGSTPASPTAGSRAHTSHNTFMFAGRPIPGDISVIEMWRRTLIRRWGTVAQVRV